MKTSKQHGFSVRRRLVTLTTLGAVAGLALSVCSSSAVKGGADLGSPAEITQTTPFVHPTNVDVPGLSNQRVMSSTGSHARWAYLPGDHAFNAELDRVISDQLQAQAQSRNQVYKPQVHSVSAQLTDRGCVPGSTALTAEKILNDTQFSQPMTAQTQLAITCEPVLAAGTTFAEKLRIVRGNTSGVVSDVDEVIYTDTATGEVARGNQLFAEAGLPAVYDSIFKVLNLKQSRTGAELLVSSPKTFSNLRASLSDVGFNDRGDVVVTVDRSFVATIVAGTSGSVAKATTLLIPAERATDMLTSLGQTISLTKASNTSWAGPKPVPSGHEHVDCKLVPCVAVTYDDGPSELTHGVLDAYAERDNAATTFFVIGEKIPGKEATLRRAVAEGHEIANHSYDHPAFTTLTDEEIRYQIDTTNKLITDATGQEVKVMRPPYGDLNKRTLATTAMPSILWSVDTNDWQLPGAEAIISRAVNNLKPDGIVLMHDIHPTTVEVAGDVADGLLARGFTLTTIAQLFDGIKMEAKIYRTAGGLR